MLTCQLIFLPMVLLCCPTLQVPFPRRTVNRPPPLQTPPSLHFLRSQACLDPPSRQGPPVGDLTADFKLRGAPEVNRIPAILPERIEGQPVPPPDFQAPPEAIGMPRAEGKTEVPETPPSPEKEKPVEKPPAAPPVPTEGYVYVQGGGVGAEGDPRLPGRTLPPYPCLGHISLPQVTGLEPDMSIGTESAGSNFSSMVAYHKNVHDACMSITCCSDDGMWQGLRSRLKRISAKWRSFFRYRCWGPPTPTHAP